MCCFSQPVELVSDTNIFARMFPAHDRQVIVYAMTLDSKQDLAMILPIPTVKDADEDALRFINLEEYEDFFKDMRKGFPEPQANRDRGKAAGGVTDSKEKLKVFNVGSFDASFVPTIADFDRLDERFRLPAGSWDKLPTYKEYGFAVFKLKKGAQKVHPMAFDFPTAFPDRIFFPTVHIHDGEVHERAGFDHSLFCQFHNPDVNRLHEWRESVQPAGLFLDKEKAGRIISEDDHVYRRVMKGELKNEDIWA